ncbi:nitrate reductase molybdenum cofactor assembly chaperone [Cellulomonas sp. SLBN-39]|uniref:nitrate reductase molybdenum cofactor assembly chaperone n=1 Tax=Cellulomonas sp. SLBN-39 TaxID=2768446 RepID=UPI00114E86A5|nr:nitrate reductase molybdenum cofactor assembly chaperone [Cellulomonas sp. SLBN-39]TQL04283.1 respiratory nitrate reductase chaperone NarJ [Cellulomonas sp. SLBN-39]
MSRRAPALPFLDPVPVDAEQRATTHMAAALLLAYPDEGHADVLAGVRDALPTLPAAVRDALDRHVGTVDGWDLAQRQTHYVETFDLRRRCALHLSYYSAGDTRRRGMALVTFVEAFRACGWQPPDDELPDHLPAVLELSARDRGEVPALLLGAHREGVEVLRSALHALTSPYAHVLDAVCRTLPPVDARAAARFADLVAAGPPQETVGLASPLLPFPTVRPSEVPA